MQHNIMELYHFSNSTLAPLDDLIRKITSFQFDNFGVIATNNNYFSIFTKVNLFLAKTGRNGSSRDPQCAR